MYGIPGYTIVIWTAVLLSPFYLFMMYIAYMVYIVNRQITLFMKTPGAEQLLLQLMTEKNVEVASREANILVDNALKRVVAAIEGINNGPISSIMQRVTGHA